MDRRSFLAQCSLVTVGGVLTLSGCRGNQKATVMNDTDRDLVGSHAAGAETWEPLIQQSVGQLLGRQHVVVQTSSDGTLPPPRTRICFVGVDNKSSEEIGDFRDQIYQKIDTCINESDDFEVINRRYVESGLRQCGLRPDDLFVPNHRRNFSAVMEQDQQSFDFLLFATITSGTTRSNKKDYQRDYLFTLEMVNMETGRADKESAEIRKAYHKKGLG